MFRKIATVLLLSGAVGSVSAVAEAAPHWYSNGVRGKEGSKVAVTISGNLEWEEPGIGSVDCIQKGKGAVWNPIGGGAGLDEVTEFTSSECSPVCPAGSHTEAVWLHNETPLSSTNVWPSELVQKGAPETFRDQISGIQFEIRCSGSTVIAYGGLLAPRVGVSHLEFVEGTGELKQLGGPNSITFASTLTIQGTVGGEVLTVKKT